jgi:hypothetical protein
VGGFPVPAEQSPLKERTSPPPVAPHRDMNALVVAAVHAMPAGGSYRTNAAALAGLRRSIQAGDSRLQVEAGRATPSFCSGATYLIFVSVLAQLNRNGQLPLDDNVLAALLVLEHQADGAGIWGRWNSNGPGTARLFHESDLGRNFTSFEEARAGDFMKIFWNDEIGSREAGHSVIYLAKVTQPDGEYVQYWSSNQPDGFGVKLVPRQKIKRQLFSRFEHPENVAHLASLPAKDAYLAAMLKRSSNHREMLRMVGAPEGEEDPVTAQTVASTAKPTAVASPAPDRDKTPSTPKKTALPGATPAPADEAQSKRNWLSRFFKP